VYLLVEIYPIQTKETGMKFQIKIDEKELNRQIKQEIIKTVHRYIPQIQQSVSRRLEQVLFQRLISGVPTVSGQDFYELGIPDINDRLQSIIRVSSQSFKVTVTGGTRNILKINIGIIKKDYRDLFSLPESVYQYTSTKGSGVLEWLKWVLVEGQETVVQGYDFSQQDGYGRTQGGIMVKGSGWSVPPSLQGSPTDNILLRTLNNIDKDIEQIVKQELNRIIR